MSPALECPSCLSFFHPDFSGFSFSCSYFLIYHEVRGQEHSKTTIFKIHYNFSISIIIISIIIAKGEGGGRAEQENGCT